MFSLFVNTDAVGAGCRLTPEAGTEIAILSSDRFARFGLRSEGAEMKVVPGQKYRLTVFVKAGGDFEIAKAAPGIVLRATLFDDTGKDASSGHCYVGEGGVSFGSAHSVGEGRIPRDWTKIEGVMEVPVGASRMRFFVFCWNTKGSLSVRSPSIQRVDGATPPTKVLRNPNRTDKVVSQG
jgi:hypothetical protein